jgi:hypothetical protein
MTLVGQVYLVPCVWGVISNIGHNSPARWWPVLLPSHEDSRYFNTKTIREWKETEEGAYLVEQVVSAGSNPSTPHHYHVDARFTEESWYGTDRGRPVRNLHTTIFPDDCRCTLFEMVCLREMPVQVKLYSVFGKLFVDDFTGKKIKCGRCPHKGTDLTTIPVVDGKITCPAHGMQFDAQTGRVEWK